MYEDRIAANLKTILKTKGISQKKLAEDLGLSQGVVSGYISGNISVSSKRLKQLAEYLNVDVGVFIEPTDSIQKNTSKLKVRDFILPCLGAVLVPVASPISLVAASILTKKMARDYESKAHIEAMRSLVADLESFFKTFYAWEDSTKQLFIRSLEKRYPLESTINTILEGPATQKLDSGVYAYQVVDIITSFIGAITPKLSDITESERKQIASESDEVTYIICAISILSQTERCQILDTVRFLS